MSNQTSPSLHPIALQLRNEAAELTLRIHRLRTHPAVYHWVGGKKRIDSVLFTRIQMLEVQAARLIQEAEHLHLPH
jgi:hypothetical protein